VRKRIFEASNHLNPTYLLFNTYAQVYIDPRLELLLPKASEASRRTLASLGDGLNEELSFRREIRQADTSLGA
jgi:hypothetical protein